MKVFLIRLVHGKKITSKKYKSNQIVCPINSPQKQNNSNLVIVARNYHTYYNSALNQITMTKNDSSQNNPPSINTTVHQRTIFPLHICTVVDSDTSQYPPSNHELFFSQFPDTTGTNNKTCLLLIVVHVLKQNTIYIQKQKQKIYPSTQQFCQKHIITT